MAAARDKGLTPALLDRLELEPGPGRSHGQAGLEQIAAFPDPIGRRSWPNGTRPNGLSHRQASRTPLGVIGIIYESRAPM